jgi:hypothetical protein
MNKKLLLLTATLMTLMAVTSAGATSTVPCVYYNHGFKEGVWPYYTGNLSACVANSCGTTEGTQTLTCTKQARLGDCGINANGCTKQGTTTQPCTATLIPCPPVVVPVDCSWHWSGCSATCGAGVQTPIVDTPASNGGTECVLTEQACNLGDCPVIPPAVDCPTACGLEASQVADGLGGLKDCAATDACVAEQACPTTCGLSASDVPNGSGGTNHCEATDACSITLPDSGNATTTVATTTIATTSPSGSNSYSGQYAPGYGPNANSDSNIIPLMQKEVNLLQQIIDVVKQLIARKLTQSTSYIWQISTGVLGK